MKVRAHRRSITGELANELDAFRKLALLAARDNTTLLVPVTLKQTYSRFNRRSKRIFMAHIQKILKDARTLKRRLHE